MNHPEFLKAYKSDIFYHKGKKEGAKDTKLVVDDASLCVLCVSLCFLCENHAALGLIMKIRDDELFKPYNRVLNSVLTFSPGKYTRSKNSPEGGAVYLAGS